MMMSHVMIREVEPQEREEALRLVWNVFQVYEAEDYSQEGVEEFYRSIHDDRFLSELCFYGAFIRQKCVGVIATRNEGTHIALFFVDGNYQRKGIGRQLFQSMKAICPYDKITVNSSPFAIEIYHKLGFHDTDMEQEMHGLRFTPMEYIV